MDKLREVTMSRDHTGGELGVPDAVADQAASEPDYQDTQLETTYLQKLQRWIDLSA